MIVRRYDSDRTETSGYRVRHCARPLPGETVVLGIGWDVGFSTDNGTGRDGTGDGGEFWD